VSQRAAHGPYRDMFDFCERLDARLVPRSATERLIKAGALDTFHARRSQLIHLLPRALQAAGELQEDRKSGQGNFLEGVGDRRQGSGTRGQTQDSNSLTPDSGLSIPDLPEWPDALKLKNEKEALDFYFSSHPLAEYEEDVRRLATHRVENLANLEANQEVIV